MNFILLILVSFLFLAVANLFDKYLLSKYLPSGKTYAFLVGIFGILLFFIAPWSVEWPGQSGFCWDLAVGAIFLVALRYYYSALRRDEPFKVMILMGGIIPCFSFLFSIFFWQERPAVNQIAGFVLLMAGIFLALSYSPEKKYLDFLRLKTGSDDQTRRPFFYAVLMAGFFFALFFAGVKYVYGSQDFFSSFILMRLGSFIMALVFLIRPRDRREILSTLRGQKDRVPLDSDRNKLIVFGLTLGAFGFLLQNNAFFTGQIATIGRLQGWQYAFLLLLSVWTIRLFPGFLKEEKGGRQFLWQEITLVAVVFLGLYLINI
jgi:drug/metabolite transporter (DMT)-like permease